MIEATGAPEVDLADAEAALGVVDKLVHGATARLAELTDGGRRLDDAQVFAYDLAHAAAGVHTAGAAVRYGAHGTGEARLAVAFVADVIADLVGRTAGRERQWGVGARLARPARRVPRGRPLAPAARRPRRASRTVPPR